MRSFCKKLHLNWIKNKKSYFFLNFLLLGPFYVKNGKLNNNTAFFWRVFPKEFITKNTNNIRWKISSPCTNDRNIHFYTLGPLVWKRVRLQYPKSLQIFIQWQGSLCSKFRRICQIQHKVSHGKHSVYRWTMTTSEHNTTTKFLRSHKKLKRNTAIK
jgi:hypothetical protein